MLEHARGRARRARPTPTCEADAARVDLPDAAFDAACVVQVLEYVDDPVAVLREAARLVRPGGAVLASDTDWDSMAFAIDDVELGPARDGGAWRRRSPTPGPAGACAAGSSPPASSREEHRIEVLHSDHRDGDTFIEHNWPHFRRLHRAPRAAARRGPRPLRAARSTPPRPRGAYGFALMRHAWRAASAVTSRPARPPVAHDEGGVGWPEWLASRCSSGPSAEHAWVLSDDALALVADLQRTFGPRRAELLQRRQERAERILAGRAPGLPARDRRGARAATGRWRRRRPT